MIEIREIHGADLIPVYYWDEANPVSRFIPLTLDEYIAKVSAPHWCHYGFFRDGELVGCMSIEAWDALRWEIHVSSERRKMRPAEMRRVVTAIKNAAFKSGVQEVFALVPSIHRAARRLCVDCGLSLVEEIPTNLVIDTQPLVLMKYAYVEAKTADSSNSLR